MGQTHAFDIKEWKQRHHLGALVEDVTGQSPTKNKIRCIVHDDSTPSMHIYEDGRFKCFGCGVAGDALDFLGYAWYGRSYDLQHQLREVIDRLSEPGFAATIRHIPTETRPHSPLRPTLDPTLADKLEERFGDRELEHWRKLGIPPSVIYGLRIGWTGYQHPLSWARYRWSGSTRRCGGEGAGRWRPSGWRWSWAGWTCGISGITCGGWRSGGWCTGRRGRSRGGRWRHEL